MKVPKPKLLLQDIDALCSHLLPAIPFKIAYIPVRTFLLSSLVKIEFCSMRHKNSFKQQRRKYTKSMCHLYKMNFFGVW